MPYLCEVIERTQQPTLSIRTRTRIEDLPGLIGASYGAIMRYLGDRGEQPAGMPYAAYHNMDMQDLDIELGFPVAHTIEGTGEISAGTLPGGKIARTIHLGPYEQLHVAYEALGSWTEEGGYRPTGAYYEQYHNSPDEVAADELKTEIFFPVESVESPT